MINPRTAIKIILTNDLQLFFAINFFIMIWVFWNERSEREPQLHYVFQIISPYWFELFPSGLAMTSSFVWIRILLLCPLHKELIIWEKMSLDICKRDKQRLRLFMYCNWIDVLVKPWRNLTTVVEKSFCYVTHIIMTKNEFIIYFTQVTKHKRKRVVVSYWKTVTGSLLVTFHEGGRRSNKPKYLHNTWLKLTQNRMNTPLA